MKFLQSNWAIQYLYSQKPQLARFLQDEADSTSDLPRFYELVHLQGAHVGAVHVVPEGQALLSHATNDGSRPQGRLVTALYGRKGGTVINNEYLLRNVAF